MKRAVILIFLILALIAGVLPFCAGAAERVDLIVRGGTVVTMNAASRVIEGGAVAIRGGRIVGVGDAREIAGRYIAARSIDATGKVVMPGLINTHTHVPMVLFRGIADDLVLMEWLQKYIFPAEAKNVDEQFVRWGTRLGCLEMILSGTTTYVDMYYFEDAIADETARAGMRAVLGETVIDFPAPDNKTWDAAIASVEKFAAKWKGHPLITPAIAPHAPYTVSTDHLKQVQSVSSKLEIPLIIHVAEDAAETKTIQEKYNASPVAYLDRIGLLGPRTIAAHMVWPTEDDIKTLASRSAGVAHCPQSNMKLAAGVSPVPAMLRAGVAVGLGTDGAASNNDLSMWEEMDTAAKLHKVISKDPTVIAAREALEMATIRGARAIHMDREIGSLESGKLADLIIVGMDGVHQTPLYNVYSHLVYSTKASDVETVIINGKVVMQNRRVLTLDERAIKAKSREYRDRIRRSLGAQASLPAGNGGTPRLNGLTSQASVPAMSPELPTFPAPSRVSLPVVNTGATPLRALVSRASIAGAAFRETNFRAASLQTRMHVLSGSQTRIDRAEIDEIVPDDIFEAIQLGNRLMNQERYDEAIATYRAALAKSKTPLATIHLNLGAVYLKKAEYPAAVESYRQVTLIRPRDPRGYFYLGEALYGMANYPEAEAAYRKAIELSPSQVNAQAYQFLGLALYNQKRVDEAIAQYQIAIGQSKGSYSEAHYNLGVALLARGENKPAEREFRLAIEQEKQDWAEAHFNLATALDKQGHYAEAAAELETYLRQAPGATDAAKVRKYIEYLKTKK